MVAVSFVPTDFMMKVSYGITLWEAIDANTEARELAKLSAQTYGSEASGKQ